MDDGAPTGHADSGAEALAFILQVLGLPANAQEILHQSGLRSLDAQDLLRAARRFPVKARLREAKLERLRTTPTPFLASLKDGRWLVVGGFDGERLMAHDPTAPGVQAYAREAFAEAWDGWVLMIVSPRRPGRSLSPFRDRMVPGRDRQVPPSAQRGADRLLLRPAVCAAGPAVLPGHHRQGVRPPRPVRPWRSSPWAWPCCRCSR